MCDGIIVTAIAVERKIDINLFKFFLITFSFLIKNKFNINMFLWSLFKLGLPPPYTNS